MPDLFYGHKQYVQGGSNSNNVKCQTTLFSKSSQSENLNIVGILKILYFPQIYGKNNK